MKILKVRLLSIMGIGSIVTFFTTYLLSSSIFITPLYQSEATIYAPVTLVSQHNDQQGIGFGGNAEVDAYIQILKSTRVIDSIGNRFFTVEHSDFSLSPEGDKKRFYQKLASRINIEKTRYGSISIAVKDQDPKIAASIANAVVELGDIIKEDIFLDNRLLTYNMSKEMYLAQEAVVKTLENEIMLIEMKHKDGPSENHGNTYRINHLYRDKVIKLSELKSKYNLMSLSMESGLPKAYIISAATPSHSPVWPPRLILSFAAAIVFGVLTLFFHVVKAHN